MTAVDHSPALAWPARTPFSGETVWLSAGQRSLLFWTRAQMAHGRHRFGTLEASRATGLDGSNVSRGLRRLASLALIGHRARRGRDGFHLVWAVKRTRALLEARGRLTWPTRKVATSIPLRGRYLTREGWERAARAGETRAVRRLSPPRLLYSRCPAGHRVRLARWHARRSPDGRETVGSWKGTCRRCGGLEVVHELRVVIPLASSSREARLQRRRDRAQLFAEGRIDAATFRAMEDADPWTGPWSSVRDAAPAALTHQGGAP